jgi:hypothetical protein
MRSPLRPTSILCFVVFVLLFTLSQQSMFAAPSTTSKASANLDQCRNGASTAPVKCSGTAWVNGNAGASNAHYVEGDSISYRMVMTGLSLGTHTLVIQWDTTKGGTHALDYITSWDRNVQSGSDACSDLLSTSICNAAASFGIDLTKDSAVPASLPKTAPFSENMVAYGGTVTSLVFTVTPPATFSFVGDTSQTATITFTATNSTMVLAWGGHIAKRQEWGAPIVSNSLPFTGTASNISGSPYHTRLISLDGAGGNQDRSLSAAAVASTSQITITKSVTGTGSGSFPFTASPSPISDFTLNTSTSPSTTFSNITNFTTYNVAEQIPSGWKIDTSATGGGIECALSSISLDFGTNIFTKTIGSGGSSGSVAIALGEGDDATCIFYDAQTSATLTVIKSVVNSHGGTKVASDFSITVTGTNPSPSTFNGSTTGTTVTLGAGSFSVDEGTHTGYTVSYSTDCSGTIAAGDSKTCTVTNTDIAPKLTITKIVDNTAGGTKSVSDFVLKVDGNTVTSGVQNTFSAGSHTASEVNLTGYSAGKWTGDCDPDTGAVALNLADVKSCTITNTAAPAKLHVVKTVQNTHGGTKTSSDFSISVKSGGTNVTGSPQAGSSTGTEYVLNAGSYAVSESSVTGYQFVSFSGACDSSGNVTLNLGDDVTCTITNADVAPTLHVIKVVNNPNGGAATPSNFSIHVKKTGVDVANSPHAGASSPGTLYTLSAGAYSVSEENLTGYTLTGISGDCDSSGAVALSVGQNKTCTITNTDLAPNLTIVKTPDASGDTGYFVSPGGTAQFTLTVSNTGQGNAYNVLITDTLPSDVGAWTSDQTTACTITTNTSLSCSLAGLAPGGSFVVNLTATVPSNFLLPATLPPGTSLFEIEGDLIAGSGNKDWSNIGIDCNSNPKKGCDVDLASGSNDNAFGQGTKEDTEVPTVVAGSIPNNKSDLTRFYVATEKVSGTDFLYLAWERVQAPKGTTNMDFELNQSSQLSANNVTPVRTAGDILINYDLDSGGTVPSLGYHVWITTASAAGGTPAALCDSNSAFPCWGKVQQLTSDVAGAVNSVSVSDPILSGTQQTARSLDPLTFGEASINLQGTGIFPTSITNVSQCTSFGQAYLKSRASSTFNTEIKDFIKPISITVSNCPPKLLDNTAYAKGDNTAQVSDTGEIEVK